MISVVALVALLGTTHEIKGFPVTMRESSSAASLTVADLDHDKTVDIVVMSEPGITVVNSKGEIRQGFPWFVGDVRTGGTRIVAEHPAAACDIDGDSQLELVFAMTNQKLYALTRFGQMARGFPVSLPGVPKGPVACVATRGSTKRDIALTTNDGSLLLVNGGGGTPKTLASIGKGAEGGVAVADLNGDRIVELITVGGDAKLYVVEVNGKAVKGFPAQLGYRASNTPAIGDIDGDAKLDIVIGSEDYNIHAVGLDGKELAGFPVATKYRIYGGVALADIDKDSKLDVVAASGDNSIYAVSGKGVALPGFPYNTGVRLLTGPVVGDLDRDTYPDIVVVDQTGRLVVVGHDGKPLRDVPAQRVLDKGDTAPALADIDGDGNPDVVLASRDGGVHALSVATTGQATPRIQWAMSGHDAEHSGRVSQWAVSFRDLAFTTKTARNQDGLKIKYVFADLNGDPESDTQIRWLVDGKAVPDLDNKREVPPGRLKKGQRWSFTLQDGASYRAASLVEGGVIAQSPELVVENSAPKAPKIELTPANPDTDATLEVRMLTPAADPDDDKLTYTYTWIRDGVPQSFSDGTTKVEPHLTTKNEEWRVVVVANDGASEGEPAIAQTTIRNSAPTAPEIAFDPPAPRTNDPINVTLVKKSRDEDGEVLHYAYRYWVNGTPLDVSDTTWSLPARLLRKGDTLKVEVTAHDDQTAGGKSEIAVKLANTAPEAPSLTISPAIAKTDDALIPALSGIVEDTDCDVITWRHQWYVDGAKVDAPLIVPADRTKKGQRWKVVVTPFDGEVEGPSASAEVVIANTPPALPQISLKKTPVSDTEVIKPVVTVPKDADGDALELKYRWQRNAQRAGFPPTKTELAVGDAHYGETWTVFVIANDGEVDGPEAQLGFDVGMTEGAAKATASSSPVNRPPGAATIVLGPPKAGGDRDLTCDIVTNAEDADGDQVTYRYAWLVGGKPVPLGRDSTSAPAALTTRGQSWVCEVTSFDGKVAGKTVRSSALVIGNTAPTAPKVKISPAKADTTSDLVCQLEMPGVDDDFDTLKYKYAWKVNGKAHPGTSNRVPASATKRGETWECSVTAFDGDASSPVALANVVIEDAAPTPPKVVVRPEKPLAGTDLTCAVLEQGKDADDDKIDYRFAWIRDGVDQGFAPGSLSVPGRLIKARDIWQCTATPFDGVLDGKTATSPEVVIAENPNAPAAAEKSEGAGRRRRR